MGLDLPQHTHADLQRIEALAANGHVLAGGVVRRKLIGALVMRGIFARVRHRDELAVRAAALRGHRGRRAPLRCGVRLRFLLHLSTRVHHHGNGGSQADRSRQNRRKGLALLRQSQGIFPRNALIGLPREVTQEC
jgi:hypothetical protein